MTIHKKTFGPDWFHFFFVSWTDISLGINIDVKNLWIEVHVPFGFFHIGRSADKAKLKYCIQLNENEEITRKQFIEMVDRAIVFSPE